MWEIIILGSVHALQIALIIFMADDGGETVSVVGGVGWEDWNDPSSYFTQISPDLETSLTDFSLESTRALQEVTATSLQSPPEIIISRATLQSTYIPKSEKAFVETLTSVDTFQPLEIPLSTKPVYQVHDESVAAAYNKHMDAFLVSEEVRARVFAPGAWSSGALDTLQDNVLDVLENTKSTSYAACAEKVKPLVDKAVAFANEGLPLPKHQPLDTSMYKDNRFPTAQESSARGTIFADKLYIASYKMLKTSEPLSVDRPFLNAFKDTAIGESEVFKDAYEEFCGKPGQNPPVDPKY